MSSSSSTPTPTSEEGGVVELGAAAGRWEEDDNDNDDNDNDSDEEEEGQDESGDKEEDEESSSSLDDDDIDELLEEGMPALKRKRTEDGEKTTQEYNEKEIVVLEEKKNALEVLPGGWIEIRHSSGMPLYLHRETRVCTLAKPYFLGKGSARRHSLPLSAIPCLAYRKNLQPDPAPAPVTIPSIPEDDKEGNEIEMPVAKVATAKENMHHIAPEELREYCKAVFTFKTIKTKRFKTWGARRKHTKEQKRLQLQRPIMPDGVKLISFPIQTGTPEAGKSNKEYIMNPQGKSSVCILHEYVQHALRKQPSYIFRELENAATPYAATVVINGMQYGTGYGSSKKQAKTDAAKTALEILIPQMKEQLNGDKPNNGDDFDILPFFEPYGLLDSGITKICKNFSEPPPYGLLLTCLQRNFGQDNSQNIKFEMISPGPQSNKFRMEFGEHFVEVSAPNKREGKQLASQELLSKLHPNITNFGSFVKLYGNNSIKSVKEKKQEEQQITTLQSKASANSPNWAILSKLREEMKKLAAAENGKPDKDDLSPSPTILDKGKCNASLKQSEKNERGASTPTPPPLPSSPCPYSVKTEVIECNKNTDSVLNSTPPSLLSHENGKIEGCPMEDIATAQ